MYMQIPSQERYRETVAAALPGRTSEAVQPCRMFRSRSITICFVLHLLIDLLGCWQGSDASHIAAHVNLHSTAPAGVSKQSDVRGA
jgi:hypothetical protein